MDERAMGAWIAASPTLLGRIRCFLPEALNYYMCEGRSPGFPDFCGLLIPTGRDNGGSIHKSDPHG